MACGATPILVIFLLIYQFAVDVPISHQWEIVPLVIKTRTGGFLFNDFWAVQDANRPVMLQLGVVALAMFTGWNVRIETMANIVLVVLCLVPLRILIAKTVSSNERVWLVLIVIFLLFSPSQAENWMPYWPFELFLANLCLFGIVLLAQNYVKSKQAFIAALILSIVSVLSYSLVVWIVGALAFAIYWQKRYFLIWVVAMFLFLGVYFLDFPVSSQQSESITFALMHPIHSFAFVVIYIGSVFGIGGGRSIEFNTGFDYLIVGWSFFVGILGLISLIIILLDTLKKNKVEKFKLYIPWLLVLLSPLLNALVTTLGRLSQGLGQALTVRYTTIAIAFWIGWFAIVFIFQGDLPSRWKKSIRNILITIFGVGYFLSCVWGLMTIISRSGMTDFLRNAVLFYEEAPDSFFTKLHLDSRLVRVGAAQLQAAKLGPFRYENKLTLNEFFDSPYFTKFRYQNANLKVDKGIYSNDGVLSVSCGLPVEILATEPIVSKTLITRFNYAWENQLFFVPQVLSVTSNKASKVVVYWDTGHLNFKEGNKVEMSPALRLESRKNYLGVLAPILPVFNYRIKIFYPDNCVGDDLITISLFIKNTRLY